MSLLIRGGTIITMNDALDVLEGDVSIPRGRIDSISSTIPTAHDRVIDAGGRYLLPGFVQTHIHLCQTLFRGYADDLPLMDWLRRRIWPLEAAHTPGTLRASARLACLDLLAGGTTSVLTMETVHDTDAVFAAVAETGIRATVGKCLMDSAAEAPRRLQEKTRDAIDESLSIRKRWEGAANGRLRAAFAPRFAVSCSRELLESVAALSRDHRALVHTHASESRDELAIVREISGGMTNVAYLASVGLASPRLCTAHCVWVGDDEQAVLAEHDVKVLHCPGSNLKLGSGIAPVYEMRRRGITVSLGARVALDGDEGHGDPQLPGHLLGPAAHVVCGLAECLVPGGNEVSPAGARRRQRRHRSDVDGGHPGVLPARQVLWMATRGGARTLGLEAEIGSIETGKRADLIIIDGERPHLAPGVDPFSMLVYAARGSDVTTTIVDGDVLIDEGVPVRMDRAEVVGESRTAARDLIARAGL